MAVSPHKWEKLNRNTLKRFAFIWKFENKSNPAIDLPHVIVVHVIKPQAAIPGKCKTRFGR
jgi:hypothetical protein